MITHLGRVVYDRKPHRFSEKDVSRILTAALEDLGPRASAEFLTEALQPFYKRYRGKFWGFAAFVRYIILGWFEAQVYTKEFLLMVLDHV